MGVKDIARTRRLHQTSNIMKEHCFGLLLVVDRLLFFLFIFQICQMSIAPDILLTCHQWDFHYLNQSNLLLYVNGMLISLWPSRMVVIPRLHQHFLSGDGIRQIGRRSTSHSCLHYSRGRCCLFLLPLNVPTVMPSVDKTRGSRDAITAPKNPSGVMGKQVMWRHLDVRKNPKP